MVFPDRFEPDLLSEPDEVEPRSEQVVSIDDTRQDMLTQIVRTLGEDPAVRRCVDSWQEGHPDDSIHLEVHFEPPAEVRAVHVGPRSLSEAPVSGCLEKAASRVNFRFVELERPGSVTLGFD